MQEKETILQDRSFYLAFFAHIIVFLLIVLSFHFQSVFKPDKAPQLYLPSYIYQGEPQTAKPVPVAQPQSKHEPNKPRAKNGLLKADKKKAQAEQPKEVQQQASEAKSQAAQQAKSRKPTLDQTKNSRVSEAVNLVGEKTTVKPLIEILGRSLGRYLQYPKMAYEFNLKGTSYIGFTLHPNGMVTEVKVIKSSGASLLDDAAVQGVKDMSPVLDVKPFVPKPEQLVVGIIFK